MKLTLINDHILKSSSPFYAQNRKTDFKKGKNGHFGQTNGQNREFELFRS